jgi:anti-sigma B factor antagonist
MFEIRFDEHGNLRMAGRLDAAQCERALQALDASDPPAVVDLSALEYISSAGLGVLLKTQKRAMASGRGMRLVGVNRHIFDIFRYAGFDRLFDIEPAA